jgi:hypothetical protein
MHIVFLFLLTFSFCILNGAAESKTAELRPEDIHGATLIVGCVRGPGRVQDSIAGIVSQATADFSHNSSFPGENVISVDRGPCRTNQPHIEGDWLTLPFADNSQKCVMFEWLPSCDPEMSYSPLLFQSARKAYSILAPCEELIIDHMPYVNSFPDDYKEALTAIRLEGKKTPIEIIRKIPKELEDRYPGIISQLWQQYDPFTISRSFRERVDIFNILRSEQRKTSGEALTIPNIKDRQTNSTAVAHSIEKLADIFKKDLSWVVSNLVSEMKEEIAPKLFDTFEWIYGMYSRGPVILEALRTIGFEVAADAMQYHEINPYNGRRHAWIIKARKPAIATAAAEAKEEI